METRREYLQIEAFDPVTQATCIVQVSFDRIHELGGAASAMPRSAATWFRPHFRNQAPSSKGCARTRTRTRAARVGAVIARFPSDGSLIKGVSRFCERVMENMPGFNIEIIDGRVKLAHLFRAQAWASKLGPQDTLTITYRKLIKAAEEADINVEVKPTRAA